MDATDRVNDLVYIGGRLAEVLEKENEALNRQDVQAVDDLLDDKIKLIRAYETRLKAFQENPGQINEADEDLRQELAETGQHLSELMQENASLLEAAVSASRSVVEAFVEAMRVTQSGTTYYDQNAALASEQTRPGARGAAITVDQTL